MTRCLICGGPWDYNHHWTGRDDRDRYLDPEFKSPICHDDHYLLHDDWHTQAIEELSQPHTFFERVEIRLRRWASNCARIDEARGGGTIWGLIAAALVRWAEEMARGIRRLNERYPDWKEDPGFYPTPG